ncbi:Hypothetical predicted protein [Olea europaea subsp. europaea]|uniref:Uncharacterized protein n=1 Tax=Olea europaea subsp. europaea TaxID=158383 RepID=A0A8S0S7N5_OLEEU|nr:Hypothetical predicted protein [Olea europaea subsp. europaea]
MADVAVKHTTSSPLNPNEFQLTHTFLRIAPKLHRHTTPPEPQDTGNKGRLFFTCSNDCGYFDWVKDEASGAESSSINDKVNEAPDKDDEELPRLFDGLARISEKHGVDISLHMTFSKGKGIEKCHGEGKSSV